MKTFIFYVRDSFVERRCGSADKAIVDTEQARTKTSEKSPTCEFVIVPNRSLRTLFVAHGQGFTFALFGPPRALNTGGAIGGRRTSPLFDDEIPEKSVFESNGLKVGRNSS